jgi:hypothetical protein
MGVVLYATYLYSSPDRRQAVIPDVPPSEYADPNAQNDDEETTPALAEYQKSDGVR